MIRFDQGPVHGRVVRRPVETLMMTLPFSDSIVLSVYTRKQRFKKHRFQIAPLWRAFSNGSVFGDRFRRCSVDDSRIGSKTAPVSFENGLVWTGPKRTKYESAFHVSLKLHLLRPTAQIMALRRNHSRASRLPMRKCLGTPVTGWGAKPGMKFSLWLRYEKLGKHI